MDFYFGTQSILQSVQVPTTGLGRTRTKFRTTGTLTSGGGWARESTASHNVYTLNWDFIRNDAYAQIAALFDSGDLIHFLDPQAAYTNSLPPYVAEAGNAATGGYRLVGYSGTSTISSVSTLAPGITDGPTRTAFYNNISSAARKQIWLPIPTGHTLHLRGVTASTTGTQIQVGTALLPLWTSGTTVPEVTLASPAAQGAFLEVEAGNDITVRWLQAKVLPTGEPAAWDVWKPGLGHSGCRLDGDPSYTLYSAPQAIDYGGLSIVLRETGAWE